jgi:hypothetical protein
MIVMRRKGTCASPRKPTGKVKVEDGRRSVNHEGKERGETSASRNKCPNFIQILTYSDIF